MNEDENPLLHFTMANGQKIAVDNDFIYISSGDFVVVVEPKE